MCGSDAAFCQITLIVVESKETLLSASLTHGRSATYCNIFASVWTRRPKPLHQRE